MAPVRDWASRWRGNGRGLVPDVVTCWEENFDALGHRRPQDVVTGALVTPARVLKDVNGRPKSRSAPVLASSSDDQAMVFFSRRADSSKRSLTGVCGHEYGAAFTTFPKLIDGRWYPYWYVTSGKTA